MGIQRLEILYEYKLQKLIHKKYLQVDETTLRVLESEKKGATHLGYFWVYNDPIAAVRYLSMSLDAPKTILPTSGKALGAICKQTATKAISMNKQSQITICWAHVRRNFDEALKNEPAPQELPWH